VRKCESESKNEPGLTTTGGAFVPCEHRGVTASNPPSTTTAPAPQAASPWRWIPTLYFGQGLPYVVVMTLAVVMYKNLGVSNTDIALLTSWLYLPWVIKPLWGPMVDLRGTKRRWIVVLQFFVGAALAMVALAIPAPKFLQLTLAMFWLMAFASATHDIAADGFYMLALPQNTQAAFVGVRSTFYRLAMIGGQGGLVYLAGLLQKRLGSATTAWAWVFAVLALLFFVGCTTCGRFHGPPTTNPQRPAKIFGATSSPSSPRFSSTPTSGASCRFCCCTDSPKRNC
jgi:hypothetical protein